MNGYKVTDYKRTQIYGVACRTLQELKQKGCRKLKLQPHDVIVRLQDGTFVEDEDYFKTLAKQTLFLLVLPDQNTPTGYEILYNTLCAVHKDYLNVGKMALDFISHDMKRKFREIATAIDMDSTQSKAKLSTRQEDPDWFMDLDTNASTKEAFMSKRSQDRIRGYLYKSQDDIKHSDFYCKNAKGRAKLDHTFSLFKAWLKKVDHFSCYFNRACTKGPDILTSLCDSTGEFHCQGRWNDDKCLHHGELHRHCINPYASREARILFSTWNLDHRIERSRQIGPTLLEAAKYAITNEEDVDATYFFILLFTRRNLKLVHIVCHDKGEHHGAVCNPKRWTTPKAVTTDYDISLISQPSEDW